MKGLLLPISILKQKKRYHVSIETLPLWNWWKLQETNNYKYLSEDKDLINDYSKESAEIYENIFNEYIEIGGLGEEYLELLELKKKWINKRSQWILTGDKSVKMESKFLQVDIDDQENRLNKVSGVTKENALAVISEYVGHISEKEITVKQFYNYINYYKSKR